MKNSAPRVRRVLLTGGVGLLLTLVALATAAWALVRAEGDRRQASLAVRARRAAEVFVERLAERVPDDGWTPLAANGRPLVPPSPRAFRPPPPVSDRAAEFALSYAVEDPSLAGAAHELALTSSDAVIRLAAARAAQRAGRPAADALAAARLPASLQETLDGVALGLLARADWARERAVLAIGSEDEDAAAALLVGTLDDGAALVRDRRDALRAAAELETAVHAAQPVAVASDLRVLMRPSGAAVVVRRGVDGIERAARVPPDVVERAVRTKSFSGWIREPPGGVADGATFALPGRGRWVAWAREGPDEMSSALLIGGFSLVALAAIVAFSAFAAGVVREARLSRLRSEFVATVGHELRTPVAVVRSSAEALALGRATTEADRERLVAGILRESERLSALLGNVLDFARMESGRRSFSLSSSDLGETVRRVVDAHRPALDRAAARLEVTIDGDIGPISHDADAIGAAVVNLLDNAAKFAPGDVALHVHRVPTGAEIVVEDHGPGVPEAERERIFERFARGASPAVRDARGSGIGLALVRHAAEAHGGNVSVEDTPGGGATFVVRLPGHDTGGA